jgi:hypothetical protein
VRPVASDIAIQGEKKAWSCMFPEIDNVDQDKSQPWKVELRGGDSGF